MTLRKIDQSDKVFQRQYLQDLDYQGMEKEKSIQNYRDTFGYSPFQDNYQKFTHFCHQSRNQDFKINSNEERVLNQIFLNQQEPLHLDEKEGKFSFDKDYQLHHNSNKRVTKQHQTHKKDVVSVLINENIQDSTHNKQNQMCSVKKQNDSRFGSIKKNKKSSLVNTESYDQQNWTQMNLDEIQMIRMSKLSEMNQKLNKVLNKENKNGTINSQISFFKQSNLHKEFQEYDSVNLFPQSLQVQRQSQDQKCFIENSCVKESQNPTPFIEILFDHLDQKKTGKLSKTNCSVQCISEEFKFIFGGIFTKIFLKNLVCTKALFVKLCHNVIRQLDSDEVFALLKKLSPQIVSSHILFDPQNDGRSSPNFYQKESKVEQMRQSEIKAIKWRKQSAVISEQNLKEQRKSIQQIHYLSQRLSQVLATQQLQQQNEQFSEQSSLHFDELIKFI